MGLYANKGSFSSQAAQPINPGKGDLWSDIVNDSLKIYNGISWVDVGHSPSKAQTLTNKTIDADSNTVSNFLKGDLTIESTTKTLKEWLVAL